MDLDVDCDIQQHSRAALLAAGAAVKMGRW
jgi:hypothetical protein